MKLIGIDNLKKDVIYGLLYSVGFIFANILGLFSLALPPVAAAFSSNVASLLVIVLIAPIVEEVLFRGVGFQFFYKSIFSKIKSKGLKNFMSNLFQAVLFGSYHLLVYSSITLEKFQFAPLWVISGSFISAIAFGMIARFIAQRHNNLFIPIITHAVVNLWLVTNLLVVIA